MKKLKIYIYCYKNFALCSKFLAGELFLSIAQKNGEQVKHTFACWAVDVFLSSSWHFQKKCWAIKIQADEFWADDPSDLITLSEISLSKTWSKITLWKVLSRNLTFHEVIIPMDFKTITSSNLPVAFFLPNPTGKSTIGSNFWL